ncbi:MAG TPA: Stf0 family sulfotransferase [Candidatus Babeliales bacterium]|jgi:LPS sulfotransferase NodH|nr:Stf0 family sulfotransferase [Candidatus Babeliales bacterium]
MGGLFHKLRHPRRCYVVCTIPRSGSNLLTDGLRDTRRAGMPKQFFLPKNEARYAAGLRLDPAVDYVAYVRGIVNAKTTRNEVFGFKLMSWYLNDFVNRLREAYGSEGSTGSDLELLCNAFPCLRFVRIVRRHKLRQALSTARALQTGLWKVQKGKRTLREPEFDPDLIEQSLQEAERQEKIWDDFFERIGVKPFEVEYEKLCRDYEKTIWAVLNFLKIRLPIGARVGPPATTRQADEISRVWEERFLAERPAAYSAASG